MAETVPKDETVTTTEPAAEPAPALTMDEMRALVREDDMRIMTETSLKQNEKMKPMEDFQNGQLLKDFKSKLDELALTYVEDVTMTQKVNAVRMSMSLFN